MTGLRGERGSGFASSLGILEVGSIDLLMIYTHEIARFSVLDAPIYLHRMTLVDTLLGNPERTLIQSTAV
jgi:hypothetical protein